MGFTGTLNIVGDVYFQQTPMNGAFTGQPHGLVVLGGRGTEFSSCAVTGKITIERMTISLLLSPTFDSFATLPNSMITATGGFVYKNASTSYDARPAINVVYPQATGVANYVLPPFPEGLHVGRYAALYDSTPTAVTVGGGGALTSGSSNLQSSGNTDGGGSTGCMLFFP